ncbi:gamma-glutamyltranspeptidase [Bifidobacterium adolescentis ATCC 15703]|uniref:Gamma-glutamyltranspeptidase n=1 Tax=Bifidobacterium adolescentis (strain ATCC 15703 / DSM 20083 / NCTC 11814 / E194a) TaxID=367928 RepID=A1A0I2_BIFAA|nr:gamma-glutamyltranspeptidase [Bifidobacterium adolescentis ATCC 15703]
MQRCDVFGEQRHDHGGDDQKDQRYVGGVGIPRLPERQAEEDGGGEDGDEHPGRKSLFELAFEPFEILAYQIDVVMLVIGEHRAVQGGAGRADGDARNQGDQVDEIQRGEARQRVHELPERGVGVEFHDPP